VSRSAGSSGPYTARCNVQDNVERVVVYPLRLICERSPGHRSIVDTIYEEAEMAGVPLQGKDMEIVSECAMCQLIVAGEIARTMYCAINKIGLNANILHDINFAAGRPANRCAIISEEPESRPESLTSRNLDAGFDAPIGKAKVLVGGELTRGILTRTIPALIIGRITFAGLNHQIALTIPVGVLVVRIVIQLLITPAAAADRGRPFAGIWRS